MLRKHETMAGIGKALRRQSEQITHEQLPRRWVDLILHLDEEERKQSGARRRPEAEPLAQPSRKIGPIAS